MHAHPLITIIYFTIYCRTPDLNPAHDVAVNSQSDEAAFQANFDSPLAGMSFPLLGPGPAELAAQRASTAGQKRSKDVQRGGVDTALKGNSAVKSAERAKKGKRDVDERRRLLEGQYGSDADKENKKL